MGSGTYQKAGIGIADGLIAVSLDRSPQEWTSQRELTNKVNAYMDAVITDYIPAEWSITDHASSCTKADVAFLALERAAKELGF